MRNIKKTVELEKNRNSQKSVKSVQLMGMGVYGGNDFWKRYDRDCSNVLCDHLIIGRIMH